MRVRPGVRLTLPSPETEHIPRQASSSPIRTQIARVGMVPRHSVSTWPQRGIRRVLSISFRSERSVTRSVMGFSPSLSPHSAHNKNNIMRATRKMRRAFQDTVDEKQQLKFLSLHFVMHSLLIWTRRHKSKRQTKHLRWQ